MCDLIWSKIFWLVVSTPVKNIRVGIIIPNIWKKKHVPNHQPVLGSEHVLTKSKCSFTDVGIFWSLWRECPPSSSNWYIQTSIGDKSLKLFWGFGKCFLLLVVLDFFGFMYNFFGLTSNLRCLQCTSTCSTVSGDPQGMPRFCWLFIPSENWLYYHHGWKHTDSISGWWFQPSEKY